MAPALGAGRRRAAEQVDRAVAGPGDLVRAGGEPAREARAQIRQVLQQLGTIGGRRRRRGGGSGRTMVGDEVAQRDVGLVPHGRDHGDGHGGHRARHLLVVESPQVLRPPASVESSSSTVSRNSPLSSHTVGRPNAYTCMPSLGGAGSRRLSRPNMTQRSCAVLSRSAKYQCPLCQTLRPLTSPRTHSGGRPASITARARRVTSPTVHAPSADAAANRSSVAPPPPPSPLPRPTAAPPARCCRATS